MKDERMPLFRQNWINGMGIGNDDGGFKEAQGAERVRDFYEDLLSEGELFTKDQVEEMLAVALGVSKASVWAELGTKRGFGKRIN